MTVAAKTSHLSLIGLWLAVAVGAVFASHSAMGEDRVVVRSSGSERTLQGTITEWTGDSLTLKNALGREAVVPASAIVKVDDAKSKSQQQAESKYNAGQYSAASELFMQAAREDARQWKQRQLVADVSRCYFEQSNWVTAAKRFLHVVQFDAKTPSFDAIPLFWKGAPLDTASTDQAAEWLQEDNLTAQLIAASWLLNDLKHRDSAVVRLKAIAKDDDPRLSSLAASQLWRLETATAKSTDLDRWKVLIEKMPRDLRAGPWFLLAQGLAQQSRFEESAAAAMHVPALFPKNRSLSAEALLLAGSQLKRAGVVDEAENLFREVATKFPGTAASTIATSYLNRPAPKRQ